ncbi:hypothetical protein ACLM44_02120 [Synechococcus sp. W2B2]|uniref:hypothetical protein n=1 Tax=unclassified Synechococcus TaxID=2626047 RepID=UPI00006B0CAC|nr:hypothetical protein [Synechococcus sp. WH 7805]EAR18621.1 hypothetical protein WH7805_02262 [Synechococcus sp. WH 7805]
MMQQAQATSPVIQYSGNVLERRQRAAAEYLAWADHHAHVIAREEAAHVQRGGLQGLDQRSAAAQQELLARRRMHERHLRDSAMAQLRHR